MIRKISILLALALLFSVHQVWTQEIDPEELFNRALDTAYRGNLTEAVAIMDTVRSLYPDHPGVLWSLGIWHAELGNYQQALAMWKHFREIDPGEWRAMAKLIQAYQALGQLSHRDHERKALIEWYLAAPEELRPKQKSFCRDQFEVNGIRVMAFEYFAPSGERMVYYRFSILNEAGDEDYWYSLGSYDATTTYARESGQISNSERLYHLDRYDNGSHQTFGFFEELPPYDEVKKMVIAVLQKNIEPISSFIPKDSLAPK